MNEVAILVAAAQLALSLDRGACHRPSMWRALGAEERRPHAREGESLPPSLKERMPGSRHRIGYFSRQPLVRGRWR
jgi:hypothetical protein